MPFKDISYLELCWTLCSVERNQLCNFGPGLSEEHFCENISNLDQWFRSWLKMFLSRTLMALLFSEVEPFM